MYSKAQELIDEFGYWSDHPDYPHGAWFYAVTCGDTREGYWDWVANQIANI